jgi:hypothetical protein
MKHARKLMVVPYKIDVKQSQDTDTQTKKYLDELSRARSFRAPGALNDQIQYVKQPEPISQTTVYNSLQGLVSQLKNNNASVETINGINDIKEELKSIKTENVKPEPSDVGGINGDLQATVQALRETSQVLAEVVSYFKRESEINEKNEIENTYKNNSSENTYKNKLSENSDKKGNNDDDDDDDDDDEPLEYLDASNVKEERTQPSVNPNTNLFQDTVKEEDEERTQTIVTPVVKKSKTTKASTNNPPKENKQTAITKPKTPSLARSTSTAALNKSNSGSMNRSTSSLNVSSTLNNSKLEDVNSQILFNGYDNLMLKSQQYAKLNPEYHTLYHKEAREIYKKDGAQPAIDYLLSSNALASVKALTTLDRNGPVAELKSAFAVTKGHVEKYRKSKTGN